MGKDITHMRIKKAFLILLLIFCFSVSVYADKTEDKLLSAQLLITNLTGECPSGESISRADFVKLLGTLLNISGDVTGERIFEDVDSSDSLNIYLAELTDRGIISKGNNFRGQDNITYTEALAMAVRAAGYKNAAELTGGYPSGYIKTANQSGISDGIRYSDNFSADDCCIMLYNMMLAEVMEYRGDGYEVNENKTLFKSLYGGEVKEGILTSNDITSLSDKSNSSENSAVIGGELFLFDNSSIRNYIGSNMKVFYNEDTHEVYSYAPFRNEVLTFEHFSAALTDGKLSISMNGKTKDYKLDLGYSLIYNGKYEPVINNGLLNPDSGKMTLTDNDNDGKYEVIKIESFEYFKAGKANTITQSIPDKTDGKKTLDLSDSECTYEIYDGESGEFINLSAVPENSHLGIMRSSDGLYVYIQICSEFVTGKSTGQDDEHITIDGNEYYYAKLLKNFSAVGVDGTFYLGVYGEIIAFEINDEQYFYGYLYNAFEHEDGETVSVKIFNQYGVWNTYGLTDKIIIDGSRKNPRDVLDKFKNSIGGIIKIAVNGDTLKKIDLSEDASEYGKTVENDVNNSLTKYNFTNDGYYYTKNSQAFYPNFSAKNSIVFAIPSDKKNFNKYKITNYDVFADQTEYTVIPYDVDVYGMAAVILYENTKGTVNYNMNGSAVRSMMVESVGEKLDETDEIRTYITGWTSGKFVSYLLSDDVEIQKDTGNNKLVPGDIIKYHEQDAETLDCVIVDFDAEKFGKNTVSGSSNYNTRSGVMQLAGGYVYSAGKNTITLMPEFDGTAPKWNKINCISMLSDNIVVFNRKTKAMRPGRLEDIKGYLEYGSEASFAVVRQSYLAGSCVFLYEE